MSVRQDIRDRIIFELNAAPPTGIPEAGTRRWQPGMPLAGVKVNVFFMKEAVEFPQGRASVVASRGLIYGIQVAAAVMDPADADDALEPSLEHIVKTLGATNLDKLATNVVELDTLWETGADVTARFIIGALTRWRVDFQTQRADLTKKQ